LSIISNISFRYNVSAFRTLHRTLHRNQEY